MSSWSCVSREIFPTATARLWRRLRISNEDLKAFATPAATRCGGKQDIIRFLLNDAFRLNSQVLYGLFRLNLAGRWEYVELPAQLPSYHVRELIIEQVAGCGKAPQEALDQGLPLLLKVLPRLVNCTFSGNLLKDMFNHIIQTRCLKRLSLREGGDHTQWHFINCRHPLAWHKYWSSSRHVTLQQMVLDLRLISSLQSLKFLSIRCITFNEVVGLAESVVDMSLEHLELECYQHAFTLDGPMMQDCLRLSSWRGADYGELWRSHKEESLIIIFFKHLSRQTTDHLPQSLRTLKLSDCHSSNVQLLHQHISNAVVRCPDLITLEVKNKIDLYRLLKSNGKLLFNSSSPRLIIRSWQQLSSEEDYNLHYRYQGPRNEAWSTNVLAKPLDHPLGSIVKTLTGMMVTVGSRARLPCIFQFVKDCSVPANVVMVAPHDCGHKVYPSLCIECTRGQGMNEIIREMPGFEASRRLYKDLQALYAQLQAFEIERGNSWAASSASDTPKKEGSWAEQLDAVIMKYRSLQAKN